MYEKYTTLICKGGLYADPASEFVKLACRYCSDLSVEVGGRKINAKNVLSIVSASIGDGSQLLVRGNGSDSREAVESLCRFLNEELQRLDFF